MPFRQETLTFCNFLVRFRQKEGMMDNEKEDLELNIGMLFPPWLALILAALIWACVGIAGWDFIVGGMGWWLFLVITLPIAFVGAWLILLVKASFKAKRWLDEFKQELAAIKAENDRAEAAE